MAPLRKCNHSNNLSDSLEILRPIRTSGFLHSEVLDQDGLRMTTILLEVSFEGRQEDE
jgi:hypothetical protein